jgi:hypothetical protein
MYSPFNTFIKIYTEIFHTVYKENVLSFQRKMGLGWSMPMEEVDGPSFILTDLCSSAHPDSTEVRLYCSFLRI